MRTSTITFDVSLFPDQVGGQTHGSAETFCWSIMTLAIEAAHVINPAPLARFITTTWNGSNRTEAEDDGHSGRYIAAGEDPPCESHRHYEER